MHDDYFESQVWRGQYDMRLNRKNQILELFATIEEGIEYAGYNGGDKAVRMLQECVDGFLFLTDFLGEEHELRDHIQKIMDAVHLLLRGDMEDSLFQYYIEPIKKLMQDFRVKLLHEVKTEVEVAFMPYKISMWDSLESIYREAEKDPDCTCYVVPIPYFEKDSTGQVIKQHYEGNDFPSDINLTPYDAYDFENRRPDIIYIHNPFDQHNTLTMVHPRFFSSNLEQYTDMLVYVPYYVAGSTETTKMSYLPAYRNISKIIVQSSTLRDGYLAGGVEARKVVDLGSPKLDAMLKAIEDHGEAPVEWRETIQNKKVFLFNTGIADLLSIDTWFEQTETILNYFMGHDEHALIWRPHPLTENTIKAMRPHLLGAFEMMGERLKQSTNVIVDQSSDIYPAVAVSDAMISDYSSVMMQYIMTEKPVLGLLSENMTTPSRCYYADYLGCYFIQDTSFSQFIEMVEKNEDPKKEERVQRFLNSVTNSDGSCGQKIYPFIKNEVIKESLSLFMINNSLLPV